MEKTGICRLAGLLTALRRRGLDPADEEAARLCLLDALGCMTYGAAMEEAPRFASAVRTMSGASRPAASRFSMQDRLYMPSPAGAPSHSATAAPITLQGTEIFSAVNRLVNAVGILSNVNC